MNINDFIKILKRASEVEIDYKKDQNNGFVAKIKGIINTMDNKKRRITNNEVMDKLDRVVDRLDSLENRLDRLEELVLTGFKQVNARLDRLENDVAQIKQCPTIKRELDELNNN